ncbi:MAG TPA: PQQ-binding-like beta-propeller repeat protein [Pyrinomonadaceae bacterium]|jgi:outer membrane protein assembly factor BamB|nr:PQQ-binding-like beta-propeller repeat protein [Pyrinomonadaceae bacterium]
MMMKALPSTLGLVLIALLLSTSMTAQAGDWADWRGPARDGVSQDKNLPAKWSPAGENLLWKAPYGGRSAPIVMGDRVFLQDPAGKGETLQERVVCLNADTGKLIWEHRFNVYMSDVPPHRVGWASPVGDPSSGNVYALGVGGTLLALSKEGKVLWERSLGEDFGLLTTHGGRTVSPIIEGELVIVSGVTFGWGDQSRGAHRFMAFDKKTGETIWVSSPNIRPYDTTYAPPIVADINGTRLLIQGGSDGHVHALKPQTGELVWKYEFSKRGLNTGVILKGNVAILTHSEENLESSEMGMIAAVDATAKGTIGKEQIKWSVKGWQGGFSSPVIDGDRFYQVDNGANLAAFDTATGKQLWLQNLGTIQKASPVLADGKLYVGTENGKFFILRPSATGCEILDEDQLGTEAAPEAIIGSVAVSNGRVYLASDTALYCIGKKTAPGAASSAASNTATERAPADAAIAHVQVSPTELILKPGESVSLRVRLFDDRGRFIREEQNAVWSLEGLRGDVAKGKFTAAAEGVAQAGQVKATVGQVSGASRVRVVPPLPWNENFDSLAVGNAIPAHWANATGKYAVREMDGTKVLVKTTEGSSLMTRARSFMGPSNWANYTIEADVRATERRRQMGDAGVIAQRYALVLFGNAQKLEIAPWQPETARTTSVAFAWKADTWYRLKLQVENLPDGKVRARGKAWPVGEAEPAAWTIEHIDPIPNRQGSPGIFASALAEIFFDNLKVYSNK